MCVMFGHGAHLVSTTRKWGATFRAEELSAFFQ